MTEPTAASEKSLRKLGSLGTLWPFVRRHSGLFTAWLLALAVSSAATLSLPPAVKQMIDHGFTSGGQINRAFALLMLVAVVLALATAARFFFVALLGEKVAADLRGRVADEVSFGGITFRRYRGGVGFTVPTDKAFFYPEGVEGLFEIYYAPADTFETVNTLGLPLYARTIPDRDRDEWVRLEIESNPLPICTRPQVLRSARRT